MTAVLAIPVAAVVAYGVNEIIKSVWPRSDRASPTRTHFSWRSALR